MKRKLGWGIAVCVVLALGLAPVAWGRDGVRKREKRSAADALFTNGTVVVVRIELPARSMNSLRQQPRRDVKAVVREFQPDQLGKPVAVYTNVLVHLKGHWGSFRPLDEKPGFTLKLGDTNGTFHGVKKFHLNNSVQDRTYLSEWLSSELFRAAGVPMPRAAHALVELNGKRLGLYVLKEAVNRDFLAQYFEDTRGNVYGQSEPADVNAALERIGGKEPDTNRMDLRRLTSAASQRDPKQLLERLPKVLDMDRFISFMAMEMMICDWDGYTMKSHNYRVYHNLDDDKIVFIPHDKDQVIERTNYRIVPQEPQGLVARAILRLPETREKYLDRFSELYTNVFVPTEWAKRLDGLVGKLAPAIEPYDAQIASLLKKNVASLKNRMTRRAMTLDKLLNHPESSAPQFVNGIASLRGWYQQNDVDGARLERVKDASGKNCLWIHTDGKCNASWRTSLTLTPGMYSFEGLARCANVEGATDDRRGEGAGLRVSGANRGSAGGLEGTSSWRKLSYRFQVSQTSTDTVLVCELIANEGDVWFDEQSLRLVRLQ